MDAGLNRPAVRPKVGDPMRLFRLSLLLCLVGAFAGCDSPTVIRQGPTRLLPGKIIVRSVIGQGTTSILGTAENLALQNNMELGQGRSVRTGAGAAATLVFSNGTFVNLAPNTEVAIETFTQLPFPGIVNPEEISTEPSTSVTKLTLVLGEISGKVPKLNTDRGSSFVIRRGTEEQQFNGINFKVSAP